MTPEERRIVHLLLQRNVFTNQQIGQIVQAYQPVQSKMSLVSFLIQGKYITQQQLAYALQIDSANKIEIPSKSVGIRNGERNINQVSNGNYFAHYRIDQELGRGGMGTVYKVYDCKLNRMVALKVISANERVSEKQIQRFMLEAKSMASLEHPNIIKVYEVGESPQNYFTMEYISGGTLLAKIKEGKITPHQAAQIIAKCAEALSEVHKKEILHRDIKPANIMLDDKNQPRLMDFGLAKVLDTDLSHTGEILGTPIYMSPEQVHGEKTSYKSDIYSLGATLYEALTQKPPFQDASFAGLARKIAIDDPIAPRLLNSDVAVDLESICLKCLEKSPNKRYLSARSLVRDLENFLTNKPVSARPITRLGIIRKWISRNRMLCSVCFISLAIAIVSVILVIVSLRNQAEIQREAVIESQKAMDLAIKERDRAIAAEQKIALERDRAIAAEQKIALERDRALQAIQQAQSAIYYSTITLAQKYSLEQDTAATERELLRGDSTMRGWEWKWLKQFVHDEFITWENGKAVTCCDLSADGSTLVTTDVSGHLYFWEIATGKKTKIYAGPGPFKQCQFSPDHDKVMLTTSCDVIVCTLDGEKICQMNYGKPHPDIYRCAWSPNGKVIACTYGNYRSDSAENFILWDVQTGERIVSLRIHGAEFGNRAHCCAYTPDGNTLVTGGQDNDLRIWDIVDGTLRQAQQLKGHEHQILCCKVSPNGRYIVSGSEDTNLILWDVKTGRKLNEFTEHQKRITDCTFTSDSRMIISTAEDNKIILWDITQKKPVKVFIGHTAKVTSCVVSKDETNIISTSDDGTIKFWQLQSPAKPYILRQKNSIIDVSMNSDGILASTQQYSLAVDLWDSKKNKALPSIYATFPPGSCIFSPDGSKILVRAKTMMWLFDPKEKSQLLYFSGDNHDLTCCAFSPDGTKVIASDGGGNLFLWNAVVGGEKHKKYIRQFKATKFDGRRMHCCVFSPDGKKVAFSNSHELWVWGIGNSEPLWKYIHKDRLLRCTFRNDGETVVCADESNQIFFIKEANISKIFTGHTKEITEILFTSDETRMFSASADKTIKIWETEANGVLNNGINKVDTSLITLKHEAEVNALALSSDNQKLVSASSDKTIKIWSIAPRHK